MKRTFQFSLSIILLFAVQESLFRWLFPLPELSNFDRVNYHAGDPGISVQDLGNKSWQWISSLDTNCAFVHHNNAYGFRDVDWEVEKSASKKRVMVVGDSFTEGLMSSQHQTLPAGFARAAGPNYEVMNMGMSGMGVESYLKLINDAVPIFKPDVLLLELYANDFSVLPDPIPKATLKPAYYNPFCPRVVEVLLMATKGNPLPSRFGTKPEPVLKPWMPTEPHYEEEKAQIERSCRADIAAAVLEGTFARNNVNALAVSEFGCQQRVSFLKELAYVQAVCAEAGTELVVAYLPLRSHATDYYFQFDIAMCQQRCNFSIDMRSNKYQIHRKQLAEDCDSLNLQCVDLTALVTSSEMEGNHLYWNYDTHMRGHGYMLMGTAIYKAMQTDH